MFISVSKNRIVETRAKTSLGSSQDVLAILPTGFGKSLFYQAFYMVKLSSNANTSVFIIWPLNSIIEEQVNELKIKLLHLTHVVSWRTQQVTGEKAYVQETNSYQLDARTKSLMTQNVCETNL